MNSVIVVTCITVFFKVVQLWVSFFKYMCTTIEEGLGQKPRQRSSCLFGGQNLFNPQTDVTTFAFPSLPILRSMFPINKTQKK